MKLIRSNFILFLYSAFLTLDVNAQLSGNYTIGGTAPDYANLSSAVTDLHAQGVAGPVTFKIRNGTYSEHVVFTSWVGMSADNLVTFQSESGDSSLVKLQHAGTGINDTPITIDGADYLLFYQLAFKAHISFNYNRCAILKNGANDIAFKNCSFYGSSSADNVEENLVGIEFGTGALFEQCRFENGYRAISILDYPLARNNHTIVRNCEFYNFKNVGIHGKYIGNITAENNYLFSNDYYAPNAIYMEDINGLVKLIGNRIQFNTLSSNSLTRGIFLDVANPLPGSLIANNMIFLVNESSVEGIRSNVSGNGLMNLDIAYNTVRLRGGVGSNSRAFIGGGTGCRILNNIFVSENSPAIAYMDADSIDFNIFYTDGSVDWTSSLPSLGPTNFSINPWFISATDLHVVPSLFSDQGSPMTSVLVDIDGDARDLLNPDIGADETPLSALEASITDIISPYTDINYCGSVDSIRVVLSNLGSSVLTNSTVNLYVNGVLTNTLNWTGALARFESDTLNLGTFTYQSGVAYNLMVECTAPNGGTDENTLNDSQNLHDFHIGLSGTYTLGGLNPDFASFHALQTALTNAGLCGPVTVNVRNGSYHDYLYLKNIAGSSAQNTLTIQGESGDSSLVSFWEQHPSEVEFTLQLEDVSYITFKDLTIENRGAVTHNLVVLRHVHDITFESIRLKGYTCSGCSSETQKSIYGIQVDSNLVLNKVRYMSGGQSLVIFGSSEPGVESRNLVVTNSKFGYFTIYNFTDIQMKNNTIGGGFSKFDGCGKMEIERNKFPGAVGFFSCGDVNNTSYFRNNTVFAWETGGASNTWDWALYLYGAGNIHFYHNTIKTKQWAGILYHSGNNIQVHNNLFHQEIAQVSPYYSTNGSANGLTSDYNVFWTDNPNNPLQNIQNLYGEDLNSQVINPLFLTHIDSLYWPTNPLIDNLGISAWNVSNDLYAHPRGLNGDPGAIEQDFIPVLNLGADDTICSGSLIGSVDLGYTYLWNTGDTTSQIIPDSSGTYILSASNGMGSDSDTIHIVVVQSPTVSLVDSLSVCFGESVSLSVLDEGLTYSWSNGDADTLAEFTGTQTVSLIVTNASGCAASDSTYIMEYPVIPVNLLQSFDICEGDSVFVFDQYESTGGIYYDSLQAANGCDSIVSIVVNHHFQLPIQDLVTIERCLGDSALIFGLYHSVSGVYYDSLQTIHGCDSIVRQELVIHPKPTLVLGNFAQDTVCVNSGLIALPSASPSGGLYFGSGVNGNQFNPSFAGIGTHFIHYSYTDANGCSNEDSLSILVDGCIGIVELNQYHFSLSPNPFDELAVLDFGQTLQGEFQLKIYDLVGQVIHHQRLVNESKALIEGRKLGLGTFILVLADGNDAALCTFRIVVE